MTMSPRKRRAYDLARAHGFRSRRPVAGAVAVVEEIKARTLMSDTEIAEAAGLSAGTLKVLRYGLTREIQFETYRRLKAFLDSNPAPVRVPIIGAQRRLDGLSRMGWSLRELQARVDFDVAWIRKRKPTETISVVIHQKMVALYDELSMIPGPSSVVRQRAEKEGRFAPLAWDEDTIDDPAAQPNITGGTGGRTPPAYADHGKIERRLQGDKTVYLNKYEAAVVRKHLEARNIGAAEMERTYGIRSGRGMWWS